MPREFTGREHKDYMTASELRKGLNERSYGMISRDEYEAMRMIALSEIGYRLVQKGFMNEDIVKRYRLSNTW